MLDTKRVGLKIAALRKMKGYTQEKLAEFLCLSPQAISKWENGHTLPDTSLLPVISQIFDCSIDDIIMPAYSFDTKIEEEKPDILQLQAEQVAKYVIKKLDGTEKCDDFIGLSDNEIITAINESNPNIGNMKIIRSKPEKHERFTIIYITINSPQQNMKLVERIYYKESEEISRYEMFSSITKITPLIYYISLEKGIVLMEDLNDYIQGFHSDEDNELGKIIRDNYFVILDRTVEMHSIFWENKKAFEKIGFHWRHQTRKNLLHHINGMEEIFLKYRKEEQSGKVPKVWHQYENRIDKDTLDLFQYALHLLKEEYPKYIDSRFLKQKEITLIHGDLHPGNLFLSKSEPRLVKLIDLEAVRIGLCTEDLAMLIALHFEADKDKAMPLIDYYYNNFSERIKGYSYEIFLQDYKISIMELMFWPIKLFNNGIFDFSMRDKAIKAFNTWVLN